MHGRVTRHSDLSVAPQCLARLLRVSIILPQMDPIRLEPLGKGHTVIDDECNVMSSADILQRSCKPRGFVLVKAFNAVLKRSHKALTGNKSALKPLRKVTADFEGRNEIKLGCCVAHTNSL